MIPSVESMAADAVKHAVAHQDAIDAQTSFILRAAAAQRPSVVVNAPIEITINFDEMDAEEVA